MSVINFNGLISPSFFTSFQTIKVPGAQASADENYVYYVANEAVFEFSLEVPTPAGVVVIERHATAKDPLYDKARSCFICDPTPSASLEKLADAVAGNKLVKATIKSLKLWVKPFFLETLKLMTRSTADTVTLARPDAASKQSMEASFNHRFIGDEGRVTHPKDVAKELIDIPCDLAGVTVVPALTAGDPPRVALSVIMRIKERLPAKDRDEVALLFLAADYTKIYKNAKTEGRLPWFTGNPATGIELELRQWEKNLAHYLWNHTSMTRGNQIFKEIVDAGTAAANAGKPTLDIVKVVRDEIDARMVTANHWGQQRENRFTETYQRKLSDVFGLIHSKQWLMGSPVAWLRNFADKSAQMAMLGLPPPGVTLTDGNLALFALQWGVGHCGEHANVTFEALAAIMNAGHAAKFNTIVRSGNANIDHAFVVGGFDPPTVVTTRLSKDFFLGAMANDIDVIDLAAVLAANPGKDGFVCDPYLDPSVQAQTCKKLLAKLNDNDHKNRTLRDKRTPVDKRTDFIQHTAQHPAAPSSTPPPVKVLGLRGL